MLPGYKNLNFFWLYPETFSFSSRLIFLTGWGKPQALSLRNTWPSAVHLLTGRGSKLPPTGAGILASDGSREATCYVQEKLALSIKSSREDPGNHLDGRCPWDEGRLKFSLASETDQYSFCSVPSCHPMRPQVHA